MAYKCELWCDYCGESVISYLNVTVPKEKIERQARKEGWSIYRHGWICPSCIERAKNEELKAIIDS